VASKISQFSELLLSIIIDLSAKNAATFYAGLHELGVAITGHK